MNEIITLPDRNLEAAIRRHIFKPEGDITADDVNQITTLWLDGNQIVDPSGLAAARKLAKHVYGLTNQGR